MKAVRYPLHGPERPGPAIAVCIDSVFTIAYKIHTFYYIHADFVVRCNNKSELLFGRVPTGLI